MASRLVILLLSLFSTFSVAKPGFQLIETEDEAGDEVEEVEEVEKGSGDIPADEDVQIEQDIGQDGEDMNRVMTKK